MLVWLFGYLIFSATNYTNLYEFSLHETLCATFLQQCNRNLYLFV